MRRQVTSLDTPCTCGSSILIQLPHLLQRGTCYNVADRRNAPLVLSTRLYTTPLYNTKAMHLHPPHPYVPGGNAGPWAPRGSCAPRAPGTAAPAARKCLPGSPPAAPAPTPAATTRGPGGRGVGPRLAQDRPCSLLMTAACGGGRCGGWVNVGVGSLARSTFAKCGCTAAGSAVGAKLPEMLSVCTAGLRRASAPGHVQGVGVGCRPTAASAAATHCPRLACTCAHGTFRDTRLQKKKLLSPYGTQTPC